jgi:tetratricopeptide (TPR) repeat protein
VFLAAAGAIWLAGCNTTSVTVPTPDSSAKRGEPAIDAADVPGAAPATVPASPVPAIAAATTAPDVTGSIVPPLLAPAAPLGPPPPPPPPPDRLPSLLPNNFTPSMPSDDLSLAKENFRQGNYGLAEHYFRRSVEAGPRDAESWLGLAASYDRLKRFDLADRAYEQLLKLTGPTPSVLNNIGFSYMLRGDFARARKTLLTAQAQDPGNPYIQNNLVLLEKSIRNHKSVR